MTAGGHGVRGGLRAVALAACAMLLALIGQAALPSAATAHLVAQDAAEVLDYWTPERMESAQPGELIAAGTAEGLLSARAAAAETGAPPALAAADGDRFEVTQPGAVGNRTHGKVFLTINGADFVCSGTVTRSFNLSLVTTAGHCVSEGSQFASNWMFVPAYSDGAEPFGRWVAGQLGATAGWKAATDLRYDVGMAVVRPALDGKTIEETVGARPIGFNQPRRNLYRSYGYPARGKPEFTGQREFACTSSWRGDDQGLPAPRPMRIACDMTEGSSGGGWIARGTLLSVNSFKTGGLIGTDGRFMYGPYFGDAVRGLYEQMRGKPILCGGEEATIFGTQDGEKLKGTSGDDVIAGLGGADRIEGGGGKDLICGGNGHDRLRGGRGLDFCHGGKGRDRAKGCETAKRL